LAKLGLRHKISHEKVFQELEKQCEDSIAKQITSTIEFPKSAQTNDSQQSTRLDLQEIVFTTLHPSCKYILQKNSEISNSDTFCFFLIGCLSP
jgi:hypothetical protein